jgi:uncharacterized protein YbjT (DUF2867 family)
MRHLILGGTGTVGSAVVNELLARGEKNVRVLTRSPEKAAKLPPGTTSVIGDLGDPTTHPAILCRLRHPVSLNLVTPGTARRPGSVVNQARRQKAKRIVKARPSTTPRRAFKFPLRAAKVAIEAAIRDTGIAYTMIRLNNFYQNDYWYKDVILQHGIYPQPIGEIGLARRRA